MESCVLTRPNEPKIASCARPVGHIRCRSRRKTVRGSAIRPVRLQSRPIWSVIWGMSTGMMAVPPVWNRTGETMTLFETVQILNGNTVTRIKSSAFYYTALVLFPIGIYLLTREIYFGATILITLVPCLLLYPLIRFLFGGKDSVAAVVTTIVVEEVVKAKVSDALREKKKKRRR